MPKRPCIHRAEWRLLRGKPAQPLPAHYRLDCEFGTPLIAIYREGEGDNPLYLCERHATEEREAAATAKPRQRSICDASAISVEAPEADNSQKKHARVPKSNKREGRIKTAETPAPKRTAPVVPKQDQDIDAAKSAVIAVKPDVDVPNLSAAGTEADVPAGKPVSSVEPPAVLATEPIVPAPKPNVAPPPELVATPAAKVPPPAKSKPVSKGSARDLTYGNPAKALVDETIWNLEPGDYAAYKNALQQGKSAIEAAQAAGGQMAVVHRKIQEYAAKIEALLSASTVTLNSNDVIYTVLERETLKVIADTAMAEVEKDAAVGQLGDFQESINRELKHEVTPLDAHRIALLIGDRANWGAASRSIPNGLKPAYRALFGSIRDAIRAAVPDVRDPDERLVNLYAAKADLEAAADTRTSIPADPRIAAPVTRPAQQEKFAEI